MGVYHKLGYINFVIKVLKTDNEVTFVDFVTFTFEYHCARRLIYEFYH